MSKSTADLVEYFSDRFREYAEDCLIVRDHDTKQLVNFKLRYPQEILDAVVEKQLEEQGYVRVMNLKSRRYGGSTYVQGRGYFKTTMNHNTSAFIVAHEDESTSTLFSMAKLFHERCPMKPETTYNAHNRLTFDTNKKGKVGLKSEYRCATARNVHAGKSQGIHFLHCSEEAQWEGNPDELLTSLFACIPDPPEGTEVYRESTAQGYGNTFQEDVFDTYCEGRYPYYERDGIIYAWKNPKTDWVLVFIPWFCVEKYTRPFRSETERVDFIKELDRKVFDEKNSRWVRCEALRLKEKFILTLEQLNWRRYCIENDCRGSVAKFHQNYPSTVEEAFLSKGANVFDKDMCDDIEAQCIDPLITGNIERVLGRIQLSRNRNGNFSLWEKPEKGETYYLTVDTAGGKKKRARTKGTTDEEPDRTNIDIWNHRTGNQAAQWNGHISYGSIGHLVGMVGEYYFMGTACVELNNHGYTVVEDLKRLEYPQYHQKPDEPGWFQTHAKKGRLVDKAYQMVLNGDLKINSRETVSEMRTFVEDPPGVYEAAGGNKDDRVDTMCLASEMFFLLPRKYLDAGHGRGKKRREGFSNWSRHPNNNVKDYGYREVYVT